MKLIEKMTTQPISALPIREGRFFNDTDACDKLVVCVVQWEQNDITLRPIEHCSWTLSDAERRYGTTHGECRAVVWAKLEMRPYIGGSWFTVWTDHQALRWILGLEESSGRFLRLLLTLMETAFDIVHRAGIVHQAADALSRWPTTSVCAEFNRRRNSNMGNTSLLKPAILGWSSTRRLLRAIRRRNFETLPTTPGIVQLRSAARFVEAQKDNSLCNQFTAVIGESRTQFNSDKNGIVVRRETIHRLLLKGVPARLL